MQRIKQAGKRTAYAILTSSVLFELLQNWFRT